ncbi:MAG: hypothetical protein JRJ12_05800 [Deltaproteobacteria bacterium]|nr:hypothetical protein [Deltaproteobacteria bacterium]MBW2069662.1 hypothetical protein [Deltaproteobacteria bacterium]
MKTEKQMNARNILQLLIVACSILAAGMWCVAVPAHAAENNSYRAGYVMGYQEEPAARAADPTLTYGKYAVQRREALKKEGKVPISFYRGLKDGYRHAIRKRTPKFTIEDVHLDQLPPYLRPTTSTAEPVKEKKSSTE